MDPESYCPRELPWLFPDRRRYRSACLPAGGAVQPRCWPGGASLPASPPPGAWGVGAGVFSTGGAASNKKASQGCKARSSVVPRTQCMLVWRLHKHACRLTTFQRVNYLSGTLSRAELTRAADRLRTPAPSALKGELYPYAHWIGGYCSLTLTAALLHLGCIPCARNLGEETGIWQNSWQMDGAPVSAVRSVS